MSAESTVIVTGASGDIGLSIIERLIADGLKVAACCRSSPEKVARAFGSDVEIHELDLRDEASIKTCASTIIREARSVSGLVNCAGIAMGGLFAMTRMTDMRDVFDVNLFGPLLFTQYVAKKMMRQKSGSIVNITSTAGLLADPGTLAYGGSKASLGHASRVLATELGPLGIRVNAVAPSAVVSGMADQMDDAARAVKRPSKLTRSLPMSPELCPIFFLTMRLPFRDKLSGSIAPCLSEPRHQPSPHKL